VEHLQTTPISLPMSKPLSAEDVKDRPEATDEVVAEVPASQPLVVRETQRLYRLKAGRFVAVVAADTEDEARDLAASHDALQGDWCNREFASAEFEDTGETHIHGDVLISALAAPPVKQPNKG
jgi:alkanesulfonate monooxygenase SsuD/methylene tetrahydromethanopterin reductase-like flavin-dependent oxidoreductase (luciferase family)